MIRKTALFFILFVVTVFINFFLVIKAYAVFDRQIRIDKILSDISDSKNNPRVQFNQAKAPINVLGLNTEAILKDGRVANLKAFFRKYNSPLYDYAEKIVEEADRHQFDYRLLPAIAMQESNLCRVIPEDSHNCWGWGIYGDTVTRFENYDEAIIAISKGIKENYINHGLVTASAIMKKYTPSSPGTWQKGVNWSLGLIE